jgi:hypothetical protein
LNMSQIINLVISLCNSCPPSLLNGLTWGDEAYSESGGIC